MSYGVSGRFAKSRSLLTALGLTALEAQRLKATPYLSRPRSAPAKQGAPSILNGAWSHYEETSHARLYHRPHTRLRVGDEFFLEGGGSNEVRGVRSGDETGWHVGRYLDHGVYAVPKDVAVDQVRRV